MTPVQILSHLRQLTSNAEKHAAAQVVVAPALKGGGKGSQTAAGTTAAIAKAAAAKQTAAQRLTAQVLAKSGLNGPSPPPGGSPHPGSLAASSNGSTAKSTRAAGGTRREAAVPNPPYTCHACGSAKHFRMNCPKEKAIRDGRGGGGGKGTGADAASAKGTGKAGKRPLDPEWAKLQPCKYGDACAGKGGWCLFMHGNPSFFRRFYD